MKVFKNINRTSYRYAVATALILGLYAAGLQAGVTGIAQTGVNEKGLMNPEVQDHAGTVPTNRPQAERETANNPEASFDLKLRDVKGNLISLSDFKGKVIFINFWATWCPPCVAEMPSINKLYEQVGNEVVFVMISMDDNFEKAVSFRKRKDYGLPVYQTAGPIPAMYRSRAIPATYVIDAHGKLVFSHKGMANYNSNEFKKFLKGLK